MIWLAVLRHCGGHRWNNLFRFCVFLRCAPFGSDSRWIPVSPKKTRCRARGWYQQNLHALSQAALSQRPTVRNGARSSRYARWVAQGEELRKKIAGNLELPTTMELLGLQ